MSVILNPAEGWAQLGSLELSIQLTGHNGALQIDGGNGPCLAPVSFMERTRLAGYASVSRKPSQAMAKLIAEASLISAQQSTADIDPVVVSIIALTLAGANENNMPSFAESALLISQQSGWTPEQIGLSNAAEIDQFAKQLEPNRDDGWVRLKFNTSEESDLNLIQNELADNLLSRLHRTHDSLSPATTAEKDAKNSVPHPSVSSQRFSDQLQQLSNNVNGLQQQAETHNSASLDRFDSDAAAANIKSRTRVEHEVSPSPTNSRQENNSEKMPGFDIEKQADRSTAELADSVAPGTVSHNDTVSGSDGGRLVLKKGSAVEQLIQPANARRELPGSQNGQVSSLSSLSSPAADAVIPSFEQLAGPSSLFSGARPRLLNASNTFAHFEDKMTVAEHMPMQIPHAVASFTNREIEIDDVLDELATRLCLEADMRGIDR